MKFKKLIIGITILQNIAMLANNTQSCTGKSICFNFTNGYTYAESETSCLKHKDKGFSFSSVACKNNGRIGSCVVSTGGKTVETVFYETIESAKNMCKSMNGNFIP